LLGDATPADDLSNWLNSAKECEVVAIGTQECFYTNVSNVEADFFGRVGSALGPQFELRKKEALYQFKNQNELIETSFPSPLTSSLSQLLRQVFEIRFVSVSSLVPL
jgi:hypothetical protein